MKKLLFVIILMLSAPTFAGECDQFYYEGKAPAMVTAQELCFEDFVVMYIPHGKVPLWSAEYLTKEKLIKGASMVRKDNFHAEPLLPVNEQAHPTDYAKSGYDLGHMTPYKDYPWDKDIDSLANITPQEPVINRGKWNQLERSIRSQVMKEGDLYIVTGALYENSDTIGDGVKIPTELFKIVSSPRTKQQKLYVIQNKKGAVFEEHEVSYIINKLEQTEK